MTEKDGLELQVTIWKNGTEKQIMVRGEREKEEYVSDWYLKVVLRFTISGLQWFPLRKRVFEELADLFLKLQLIDKAQ